MKLKVGKLMFSQKELLLGYPILKYGFPKSMSMSRFDRYTYRGTRRYRPKMEVIIHNHLYEKIYFFNKQYLARSYNDIKVVCDFFSNYNLPQILNESIEFNDAFFF